MTRPKDGSRKASVYDAFHANGVDEAINLGVSLGLQLSSIKGWCAAWAKADGAAAPSSTTVVKSGKHRAFGRRRVIDIGAPTKPGTVVEEGEQVSAVRWDHNGLTQFINNDYLKTVEK